jgi:hypothetical protein
MTRHKVASETLKHVCSVVCTNLAWDVVQQTAQQNNMWFGGH